MQTVLVLTPGGTVVGQYPHGTTTGLPCYVAIGRTSPCPGCSLSVLNQDLPHQTVVRTEGDRQWQHTLQFLPALPGSPTQVLETIAPVEATTNISPEFTYQRFAPLYQYAVEQQQPLSALVVRYRHTIQETQLIDLRTRFPRRFRRGGVVGETMKRCLVYLSPNLSEDNLARIAKRIRHDFPNPSAYTVSTIYEIPPAPTSFSLPHLRDTLDAWILNSTGARVVHAPLAHLSNQDEDETLILAPATLPSVEHTVKGGIPPLRDPLTQLDHIVGRLSKADPSLQAITAQIQTLREHHAEVDALIFADLLHPYVPQPSTATLSHLSLIRDTVQLADAIMKEAGRLLFESLHSGSLAAAGYASMDEFADAIGLHPDTARTLMTMSAQRRPLIQAGYADRVPSRPKPKPLGLTVTHATHEARDVPAPPKPVRRSPAQKALAESL